jgi:hypothetical protein
MDKAARRPAISKHATLTMVPSDSAIDGAALQALHLAVRPVRIDLSKRTLLMAGAGAMVGATARLVAIALKGLLRGIRAEDKYEAVTCIACRCVHLVNPAMGKVLSNDDE